MTFGLLINYLKVTTVYFLQCTPHARIINRHFQEQTSSCSHRILKVLIVSSVLRCESSYM